MNKAQTLLIAELWEHRARGAMAAILTQRLIADAAAHNCHYQHYVLARLARSLAGLHYWQQR